MPTEKPRVTFTLDQAMLDRVEKFRYASQSRSQSSAIIKLLKAGLAAYEADKEKSPGPPDGGPRLDPDAVMDALIRIGWMQPGGDLTDSDLRFLHSVGETIRVWFQRK